jgi:Rps23 Pro-64 3,4-dihydroxylase Tpa1-like proline 4-hydroxylase
MKIQVFTFVIEQKTIKQFNKCITFSTSTIEQTRKKYNFAFKFIYLPYHKQFKEKSPKQSGFAYVVSQAIQHFKTMLNLCISFSTFVIDKNIHKKIKKFMQVFSPLPWSTQFKEIFDSTFILINN